MKMFNELMKEVNDLKNIRITLGKQLKILESKQDKLLEDALLDDKDYKKEQFEIEKEIQQIKKKIEVYTDEKINSVIQNKKELKDLQELILNQAYKELEELNIEHEKKKEAIRQQQQVYYNMLLELKEIEDKTDKPVFEIRQIRKLQGVNGYYKGFNKLTQNPWRFFISKQDILKQFTPKYSNNPYQGKERASNIK